jgi:hypothetical protein
MSDDASLAAYDRYARIVRCLSCARICESSGPDAEHKFLTAMDSAREELRIALEAAADAEERALTGRPKFKIGALVVLIRPASAKIPGGPVYRVEERKKSHVRLRESPYWWPKEIFRLAPTANAKPERKA